MRIFIFGITGKVGSHLAELLVKKKHQVAGLSRQRNSNLPHVEVVHENFSNPGNIRRMVSNADAVFLFSPMPDENDNEVISELAKILKESNVKHIVWMSELGASENAPNDRWNIRYKSELILRNTGILTTTLLPNYFMQNLYQFIPAIKQSNELKVPVKDAKFSMIDCEDIAGFAAMVIENHQKYGGKRFELNGAFSYSTQEAIDLLGNILETTFKVEEIGLAEYESVLKEYNLPEWTIRNQVEILRLAEEGLFDRPTDKIAFGLKSLPDFLSENLHVFKS